MSQSIIVLFVFVIIALLWAINTLMLRESVIRKLLNIVVIVAVIISILTIF